MKEKVKWRSSYVLGGIALACLLVTFALDATYSNNPQMPDPSVGRIFPREIRLHGTVYLTPSEYGPYRWLMGAVFLCAAVIILIHVVDYVQRKIGQTRPDRKER
jgi:hypothetical protein